jgi:hypothetical protein
LYPYSLLLTPYRQRCPRVRQPLLAGILQRAAAIRRRGVGPAVERNTEQDVPAGPIQHTVPRELTTSSKNLQRQKLQL